MEEIERKLERDTYMSAEEAQAFGLIDQVVVKLPAGANVATPAVEPPRP